MIFVPISRWTNCNDLSVWSHDWTRPLFPLWSPTWRSQRDNLAVLTQKRHRSVLPLTTPIARANRMHLAVPSNQRHRVLLPLSNGSRNPLRGSTSGQPVRRRRFGDALRRAVTRTAPGTPRLVVVLHRWPTDAILLRGHAPPPFQTFASVLGGRIRSWHARRFGDGHSHGCGCPFRTLRTACAAEQTTVYKNESTSTLRLLPRSGSHMLPTEGLVPIVELDHERIHASDNTALPLRHFLVADLHLVASIERWICSFSV